MRGREAGDRGPVQRARPVGGGPRRRPGAARRGPPAAVLAALLLADGRHVRVDSLIDADLWRGEPYGDLPDFPAAEAERRRLIERRLSACEALATYQRLRTTLGDELGT